MELDTGVYETLIYKALQEKLRYTIDFFDLDDTNRLAKEKNLPHFTKIIRSYYTKEL
ncbi:MAG: hypothetical protein LLG05_02205 [Porphyromonadaceae bacterium]|nr:hypothetical protein [uncultured Macellibacteroides sp.]MCE5224651.1 hypothetical protein [Porphyromonadaceae bacterium]